MYKTFFDDSYKYKIYNCCIDYDKLPNNIDNENCKLVKRIIISGSVFDMQENKIWMKRLIEFLLSIKNTKREIKVLGICFGHQIIN